MLDFDVNVWYGLVDCVLSPIIVWRNSCIFLFVLFFLTLSILIVITDYFNCLLAGLGWWEG